MIVMLKYQKKFGIVTRSIQHYNAGNFGQVKEIF